MYLFWKHIFVLTIHILVISLLTCISLYFHTCISLYFLPFRCIHINIVSSCLALLLQEEGDLLFIELESEQRLQRPTSLLVIVSPVTANNNWYSSWSLCNKPMRFSVPVLDLIGDSIKLEKGILCPFTSGHVQDSTVLAQRLSVDIPPVFFWQLHGSDSFLHSLSWWFSSAGLSFFFNLLDCFLIILMAYRLRFPCFWLRFSLTDSF